jgi:hypothetical protein
MTKEIKISIAIALIAILTMLIYWFLPQDTEIASTPKIENISDERIILPQYDNTIYQNIPSVKAYLLEIKLLINTGKSIVPLSKNELDNDAIRVQTFLLGHSEFLKDTKQGETLLHNDMMRILPAIISSMDDKTQKICQSKNCYQAEKYNFVTNVTTRAIVDTTEMKLLFIQNYPNMQPDISLRLTRIAQDIALHAPEVKKELGFTPHKKDMTMANVRGSMKESPCENTTHLCVAPTFTDHKKEQALWAVVDLTELRFAAAKWAGLGKTTTPACISERSLQNRHIMKNYCQKDTVFKKNGWEITYRLTGSDGLEIRDVTFRDKKVLKSAKIVDWHVSYQQKGAKELDTTTQTYIEGREVEFIRGEDDKYMFGYNDAMGCPMFSTSVVLPFNGPQVKELNTSNGFMLTQDFRNPKWPMACNYRYENRFEFYDDGSFRVVGVNKGRGCGDKAIYRPVMRIDMEVANKEAFWKMKENRWQRMSNEFKEKVPDTKPYTYKITSSISKEEGYYIEPNHGQFGDKSRGDNATLFVTQFKEEEGDQDLLTLGSCCKLEEEGVERYIEDNASILAEDLVIWYVPRVRNDAREGSEYCWADTIIGTDGNVQIKVWPCTVGPKFIPIKGVH